jgi:hypothetical protein
MPIDYRVQGGRLVAVPVGWPDACKLRARPPEQMTMAEMKAEIQAHDDGETTLHREYCVNPTCPAKR